MNVTIKLPELDLNGIHRLKVIDAQVLKSKNGNDMIKLLLKEMDKNVTVTAFVLFNQYDSLRNFARAFNLDINGNVLTFDTDSLIDAEVKASLRQFDDGSYVVKKFYPPAYSPSESINIVELGEDEDKSDPFAE